MADKKSFPLRLPPELHDELQRLAAAELRSVNAQIEILLREGLKKRGIEIRRKGSEPDSD
ncbi:MAG: Arc family DNA-binding protein [Fimbriimonadaceae bacterium]|nr:Arc family DNA-binding protein [Fimbriimonadaceae bacterium]